MKWIYFGPPPPPPPTHTNTYTAAAKLRYIKLTTYMYSKEYKIQLQQKLMNIKLPCTCFFTRRLDLFILMVANLFLGSFEGVGPENRVFFGPWNGNEQRSAIWTQISPAPYKQQVQYSYLWTYDLYGPICNGFDACRSITRASGRGLGPCNWDFLGRVKWHQTVRASAIWRPNKISRTVQ